MSEFVLDASVAAKWFLDDERHVQEATVYLMRMLAEEIAIHAPALLRYEFGSILTKAQRDNGRPIDSGEALRAFETFLEFPITFHDMTGPGLRETLDPAMSLGCSFQDSCYLWLAKRLECRLLTDDLRFVQALPIDTVSASIRLLTESPARA